MTDTASTPDVVARAAEVLAEHRSRGLWVDDDGAMRVHCVCPWQHDGESGVGLQRFMDQDDAHRAHQAQALAAAGLLADRAVVVPTDGVQP